MKYETKQLMLFIARKETVNYIVWKWHGIWIWLHLVLLKIFNENYLNIIESLNQEQYEEGIRLMETYLP